MGLTPGRRNVLLATSSIVATLVALEFLLRLLGLPAELHPHGRDPQFVTVSGAEFLYTNVPNAAIRFTYDSDPRGYFGPTGVVVHHTNNQGLRGPAFSIRKPAGTVRFLFLGDSVTFGEGVKDEDTYVARFEALLRARGSFPGKTVEALNLGVGGFNSAQEASLLRQFGLVLAPDYVYVGFSLNDAEPPLFHATVDGKLERRARGAELREDQGTPETPAPWSALRLTRLAWLTIEQPRLSRRTIEHYRALYAPGSAGWADAKEALATIASLCRERDIPVRVVVWPVLFRLDRGYPFSDLHHQVCDEVSRLGMQCIDLRSALSRFRGPELWVHPSDQHPNEEAHRIVAARLVESVTSRAGP